MGPALGIEQLVPVLALEEKLGLLQARGGGGVLVMDGRQAIGLHKDAPEQHDAEDQPDPPSQPRIAGELRCGRLKGLTQHAHPCTRNVISIRLSPRAGSALTRSKSGTASRERTYVMGSRSGSSTSTVSSLC